LDDLGFRAIPIAGKSRGGNLYARPERRAGYARIWVTVG
jgi:hypothetical protein